MKIFFKEFRRQLRGRKHKKLLEKERRFYIERFHAEQLTIPSEEHIRDTLTVRFPHLAEKQKGELTILAVFHNYNWERDALIPSLEKFGKVIHYEWAPRFDHQRSDWFAGSRQEMNKDLIQTVRQLTQKNSIDFIFCYLSGHQITCTTMHQLKEFGVPLVNMYLNDKEYFVGKIIDGQASGSRDICRFFDLCWTSTMDSMEKYCVEGAMPVYLPEGGNPKVHHPYQVQRNISVSFVGQRYGHRPRYIKQLANAGINVHAFGAGWPNGPIATQEMVKLYSRSHINLGFGGVADMDDVHCLKGRDFEIPMSGGLYLTQDNDEIHNWYRVGKEIMTYTTIESLIDTINALLANTSKAEEVRQNGHKRALASHTWEARFDHIFSLFGIGIEKPQSCKSQ